jgi:PAS domain S-box-containing protein
MGRPGQITALRADGSEFPAEASISHTRVNGQVVYTVIMRDVTARLASVRRIERLTNLYAALSKTNEAIVRGDNWRQLCDAVCRLIVDHGGVQAAVIRAPDQTGRMLEPVAGYGPRSDQVGSGSIDIDDPEHPTAAVFREGLSRVVDDILAVAPIAGHDAATTLGVRSVVVVPLRAGAACTGTLTVFAHEVAHFDVELTRLVEELAGDLAFAHRKFEADRALIESELRYRSLVESSLNGVVILNGENIEYANPGFVRMLGYPSTEDAVGRSILSLATPEFHPQLRGNISRLSTRPKQNLPAARMRMRRADGAVIDVQAAASSIELEGRTLIQSEIRDITRERNALAEIRALNENLEARIEERTRELRDANARLEAANRDLESFSYSVAHDLRAPLRTMNGFAQLLEMDVAAGSYDEIPRHASRISHNATRMNSLIDGLLAVARATHGALGDDRIDFAAMVADTVREANPGPRVRFDIGPLPVVRGDNPTLLQVWRNLISNAIKYSAKRDDPRIDIACELRDGEIVFHVRDNGAGFDPAYAQRLFGVFQRLHTAQEFEGNGVGLAVVRRIVERHGGRAWAEGRPDAGATFRFSLPASRIVTPAS